MNKLLRFACTLALGLSAANANAHDLWLKPSSTVLSGSDTWITVDAAVSNDKFYFNHAPLRLNGLEISAPDGSQVEASNANQGKLRSTFDLQLTQTGTYRIAVINDGIFARWKENGQPKRYFGDAKGLAAAVPEKAEELTVTQRSGRIETFVTAGKPSDLAEAAKGLAVQPVTHPNDLYSGEEATFRLTLDGKPLAGKTITVIADGSRYRDQVNEATYTSDKNGEFKVTWKQPGLYWMQTEHDDNLVSVPQAKTRHLSYSATLEVLPL